jgi:DNA-binding HxlR family transcriptional regulator
MKTIQGSKMRSPIFIGRWKPKILFSLKQRPHRHGELRRHLGSISQRMLARTLRNLESTGFDARRVTGAKVIAAEYLKWISTLCIFTALNPKAIQ